MGWQRDSALDLIGSVGRIVVEYFDVGCSRRLAWTDRPQARRLLEALARPDREFDAIVVGEAERAFCAGQLPAMTSSSTTVCRCGCPNWTGPWIRRVPSIRRSSSSWGPGLEPPEHAARRGHRRRSRRHSRVRAASRSAVEPARRLGDLHPDVPSGPGRPADFLAVQNLRVVRSDDTVRRHHSYLLAGLVRCRLCGRTMDSHWVNHRPGYRCRHGHRSSRSPQDARQGYLYVSEDDLVQRLLADPSLVDHVADPQALAEHLRQYKIIVYGGDAASPSSTTMQCDPEP
jgi:recombinase-like zinc beta ribbon protein